MPFICSLVLRGVRGENHTFDLVRLMSWPEDTQKRDKICPRFLQSLAVARVKRKISSAKKRCQRRIRPRKESGWICLFWAASLNWMDKRSKQRMNRYGESRSPYLRPRLRITSGRGAPFQSTWNRVEETIFMMRVIRVGGSWKNSRVSWI